MIISTLGSWLPGDPRGWRSRGHKQHSSGDYHQPPPGDEQAGLWRWNERRIDQPVLLPVALRRVVGRALVDRLTQDKWQVLTCAVDHKHAHLLVKLPDAPATLKRIIGQAKQAASRAVRPDLPGRIWATGGKYKLIADRAHHRRTYRYILHDQGDGAWAWSFREGVVHDPAWR